MPEEMPLGGKKALGGFTEPLSCEREAVWACQQLLYQTAVVDTWTNMVYWRGVNTALAIGKDSYKATDSLKRPENVCLGESQGLPAPWVCRGPWIGSPDPRQLQG